MKRPKPVTGRSAGPPRPVVVLNTVVHQTPSGEVWIWYARAHPRAHRRPTRVTVDSAPRSTEIHWIGPPRLCHAVSGSPSTAAPATRPGPASLDAVAGRPCESRVSGAAYAAGATATVAATVATVSRNPRSTRATVASPERAPSPQGSQAFDVCGP